MVAQATMAAKFRQRYDRDARFHRLGERRHHDRGRNARNADWLRLLETVDLLPIYGRADLGAARFSQRVPD
jgi:hypothetical protein